MKKMSKLLSLLLAFSMCLSLAACGSGTDTTTTAPDTTPAAEAATTEAETEAATTKAAAEAEGQYPVTLTDHAGRSVTIEAQPEKIVSGYYISSTLLISLGLEDKMIGIETNAKSRSIYTLAAPQLLELPGVGTAKEFDIEGCAALNPDLVIVPLKAKDAAATLEELGITVLVINPENDQLLAETIAMVGTAAGVTDESTALQAYIDDKNTELAALVQDLDKPTIYLGGNSAFLSTSGAQMYQNTLIENAGGTNAAAELADTYWAEVSYEQLLAWNPEYIILAPAAEYTIESVLSDPKLADLTAVQEGKVYQMPNTLESWDSPIPASILGSLWLASVLHGDVYGQETFEADVIRFYQSFYDVTVDPAQLQ